MHLQFTNDVTAVSNGSHVSMAAIVLFKNERGNSMPKPMLIFRRFAGVLFMLCLGLFTACEGPTGGNNNPETPTNTWIQFSNLEQFPVTVYSDPGRHNVFIEVEADGTKTVSATPNNAGTVFYTTFRIDVPDIEGVSVPYNGPPIVTLIEENKTTLVLVPKLLSISIDQTYLKLINNDVSSLLLRESVYEKVPLGASASIVNPGQNAAYEINSGASSRYTVMRNTTDPVAFPANFAEFERGKVYTFTYNGTSLALTATRPIPSYTGLWGSNEADGTLTIINNTSKGMIIFQGWTTPSTGNILGGVRGLSTKTFDISDDVNDFNIGGYMILRGLTEDEYEANKADLTKAKIEYSAMVTYGLGRKFRAEINPNYIGDYAYRVTNLGRLGLELRKNSLTGEKIGYVPAYAVSMVLYANSPDFLTIYPVYVSYSKPRPSTAQVTIFNIGGVGMDTVVVSPKPASGNEIQTYNFPLGSGMTLSSPVAYVTVANNVTNQSGQVTIAGSILTSQNGYDTIDSGETLTYEILSPEYDSRKNIVLTFYNQSLQIPVIMDGDIPVLRNGYDYSVSVSGSGPTAAGYTVIFTEVGQRDLNDIINF